MPVQRRRHLVQQHGGPVDAPRALLDAARAVRHDAHQLVGERRVRRQPAVPAQHELAQQHGQDAVELQVDGVGARQGREQRVDRGRVRRGGGVELVVRAEGAADEGGGLGGFGGGGGRAGGRHGVM